MYLFKDLFTDVRQLEEQRSELFDRGTRVSDPGLRIVRYAIGSTGESTKTDRYLVRHLGAEAAT